MSRTLAESFLRSFVRPLLQGHEVIIGRPLGLLGAEALQHQVQAFDARDPLASELSLLCAQRLLAMGILPPILPTLSGDPEALLLLAALHDLLFLARPEARRLTPDLRTALLREVTICAGRSALVSLSTDATDVTPSSPGPDEQAEEDATILHRHALIEPLFRLKRCDLRRNSWLDETLHRGIHRKQAASAAARGDVLFETPCWTELPSVVDGQGADALHQVLAGSPLSALWYPRLRETTQHAALALDLRWHAPLLRRPRLARALCHHYLGQGIPTVSAALSGPLLALLQHAADNPAARPDLITWLCLVSHLHWLAFVSPSGGGSALEVPEEGTAWFALFACLFEAHPALAQPPDVASDRALLDRARTHAARCRAAVSPTQLQSLHRLLTAALGTPAQ